MGESLPEWARFIKPQTGKPLFSNTGISMQMEGPLASGGDSWLWQVPSPTRTPEAAPRLSGRWPPEKTRIWRTVWKVGVLRSKHGKQNVAPGRRIADRHHDHDP